MKSLQIAAILGLLIFGSGCGGSPGLHSSTSGNNMTPSELETARHPRAATETGVILTDAEGKLYTYSHQEWFAGIVWKQGFKPGDIFCP